MGWRIARRSRRRAPVPGTAQVVLLLSDLQEARRVEAVRRDFIANVSHELKTRSGHVAARGGASRSVDDPAATKHFTTRMLHEATGCHGSCRSYSISRACRVASRCRRWSRCSSATSSPMPLIRFRSGQKPRVSRWRSAIPRGSAILGDRRQLATALTNLIENAIAYSSRGGRVGVGARRHAEEGRAEVEIAISDEGVGIAKADQERVFERFYRIDTARSRATGGTGLGLAIVKHIAFNHGGRVVCGVRQASDRRSPCTFPSAEPPDNAEFTSNSDERGQEL